MTEQTSPYRSEQNGAASTGQAGHAAPASGRPSRVRTRNLRMYKEEGRTFTMLTSYDALTASLFEDNGVDVLLVGDSAANNVMGESTTLPITVDDMLVFTKSVSRAAKRALVVADLPFGSYENSPQQAYETAVRMMKEGGAHAVKLEGGADMAATVAHLTRGGIPVIAHIGFTPQSEHVLGGYRVQGRGDSGSALVSDALALEAAGAFCVLLEMVPASVAKRVDEALAVPTIGIGAGPDTTGQVLVWQDAFGLRTGRMPKFVKQYANLSETLAEGVRAYVREVGDRSFPAAEHTFEA